MSFPGPPGPRSSGRSSSILLIVAAHLVASLAAAMLLVVLAVAAFEASGPAGVAILTIVQLVPTLVVVPLVSRAATARTRRKALLAAQLVGVLGAGTLGLALLADAGTLVVYLLAAVSAASTTTAWALTVAWLPALAASPGQLVASNAACMAAEGIGGLAGPLLAAALLALAGQPSVAFVAALGSVAAVVLTWLIRAPAGLPDPRGIESPTISSGFGRLIREATAGLAVLVRSRGPRLVTVALFAQTVVRGSLSVLLVVVAIEVLGLGEPGVGLLTAAIGLGGLVGAAVAVPIAGDRPLGPLVAVSLVGWGLPIAILAFVSTTPAALVLLGVVGLSNTLIDVAGLGLLQGCIADRDRAPAMAAVRAVAATGVALGAVAASVMLAVVPTAAVLVVTGALLPLLVVLLWPSWRSLDRHLLVSRDQVAWLRRCPLFRPLSLAQLEQLAAGTTEAAFPDGAVVIRQGDVGDAFYLVTEGRVEVRQDGALLDTLGPGGSFGELALLRDVPRTATVTAIGAVTCYRIEGTTFMSAVCGDPSSGALAADLVARFLPAG
ncbi:MAG: cyclic nucleotide-binding domain-containing protein [Candidatus Limnocylindrales bacterium]